MKRVLITGGSGFLGARILQQGLGDAELCSLPRGFLAAAGEAEVTETIQKLQPAAIVHAAALSDTGYCAQHPEEAHRANVELPVWVAKAACASGAKLLAFSSDQVYAGITQPGPLPETLPLQPTNVYGRCKLEMEQRVLELCPDAVLLRASWMYDLPGYGAAHPGQPAAEPFARRPAWDVGDLFGQRLPGRDLCPTGDRKPCSGTEPARRRVQLWQLQYGKYGAHGTAVRAGAGHCGAD